jgi:hypothetical protein
MSKIFLGLSFAISGAALLAIEMTTQCAACPAVTPLCAGALLGAGGVLFLWNISEHLATDQTTPASAK